MDSPTLNTFTVWLDEGAWAILSRMCFCQERLDQLIVEEPSNLVFCDSVSDFWSFAFLHF